jgi:hypothetical protein
LLIDTCSNTIRQKRAEIKLNIKICIKNEQMRNVKCFVIPGIIGATTIVNKELEKSGNNTRNSLNRFSIKTAVIETSDIIREVLQFDLEA